MEDGDVNVREKTMEHLYRLSVVALNLNKPLSNYFTFEAASLNDKKSEKVRVECPSCGHTYQQHEDKFRLQAKVPLTGRVSKLLRKYAKNKHSLGKCQLHMVDRYLTSRNSVKMTCSICGKSEKLSGQLREKREVQKKAQRVPSEEVNDISEKTRKEKRKELKMKSKQRKREKLKDKDLNGAASSSFGLVSLFTSMDGILGITPPSTGETAGEICSDGLTTTTSQGISEVTATSEIIQCNKKNTATSESIQSHNKDTVTSKIIQSYIKDKGTKSGPAVNSKSAKRLKSKNSHQRLSKMLAQQSKGSQGGSLTDFLSLL